MPPIMTYGGIALAVLGLLIVFAGMPDRAAGLGLGSDLIHSGATLFAAGLILAALGQILKALRDVADRIDDAGFVQGSLRNSFNEETSDRGPIPLPRAVRGVSAAGDEDFADIASSRARDPRAAQPTQPPLRQHPISEDPRPQPRTQRASVPQAAAGPQAGHADDYPEPPQNERPAPRWMRTQPDTAGTQQHSGEAAMQPRQTNRVGARVPPAPPRRETSPVAANSYEPSPRRRPEAQQVPLEAPEAAPTVVRSGIIAGMAYTLYSDRSIEAELPAGTVRFGSIEELQEHVRRAGAEDQDEYREPNTLQH